MDWITLTLLAALLWAVNNIFDKISIDKFFSDSVVYIFTSRVAALLIFIVVAFFLTIDFSNEKAWLIVLSGGLYTIGGNLFAYSLRLDEVSRVSALWEFVPMWSILIGYFFLAESLSGKMITAFVLFVVGAFIMSIRFNKSSKILMSPALIPMLCGTLMFTLGFASFKYFVQSSDFWTVWWLQSIGDAGIMIIVSFLIPSWRKRIIAAKMNVQKVIMANANALTDIAATVCYSAAIVAGPIALVSALERIQSFLVFLLALLFTLFLPKILKEDFSKSQLLQKLLGLSVLFVGVLVLNV